MKKILCHIFMLAAIAVICPFPASSAPKAEDPKDSLVVVQDTTVNKIVVDGPYLDFGKNLEYDFGKISERGGKKTGSYTFKNSGNKPLVITKVMVSCKCISLGYPKKPVMPGEEGKITVTYDPKKQKGVFHKAIQIYSNDSSGRVVIFAKGEVVE